MVTTESPGGVRHREEHHRGERHGPDRGVRPDRAGHGAETWASGWQPLAGAALLARLRVTGRARPVADPVLVADLRAHVEAAAGVADARVVGLDASPVGPIGAPITVTKDRLTRALACVDHATRERAGRREFSMPLACGALVDVLFRQLVSTGSIGVAMDDALDALGIDERQAPLLEWIASLAAAERSELRAEVDRQAEGLRQRWPALDPAWLPRTQECLRVPVAGGGIELLARVDLAIGRPGGAEATVALVDVSSGSRRAVHRADRQFHALVETLRAAVPPFAVATYYARTGELDVDPVTPDVLVAAARRCRVGTEALVAPGSEQRSVDRGRSWCAACADSPLGTAEPVASTSCERPSVPPVTAPLSIGEARWSPAGAAGRSTDDGALPFLEGRAA